MQTLAKICVGFGLLAVTACGTIYKSAQSIHEITADTVMLVGRIELVPKLSTDEQRLPTRVMISEDEDMVHNRAVFALSETISHERKATMEMINPVLERDFYIVIPKSRRYIVYSSVIMDSAQSHSGGMVELVLPSPIELDIRKQDQAIYLGTWRFHRDEFNELLKSEVLEDGKRAEREFQKKFATSIKLRKALPKTKK